MPFVSPANPTNRVSLKYNPYQQEFFKARRRRLPNGERAFHRFTLISGRRGGKTLAGAIASVEEASIPNTIGWVVAPSYPELHDYVIPAVRLVMPQSWLKPGKEGWSGTHYEMSLRNGSIIQFRPGDDPERMRGPGLHWIWFDEVRKMPKLTWHTARPMLSKDRGAAYFTTSPNGPDWVWKELWQRAAQGVPGYWAVRYKTRDNPAIPREEIEEARATMDPLFFAQEYEAEFVTFEGAVYGTYVDHTLLETVEAVKRYIPEWPNLNPDRPVVIGMDPGSDHPFAAVKIVSTPEALVVVDEHLKRNAPVAVHAQRLKSMAFGSNNVRWGIDRSAKQIAIELAQHGIYPVAAENDVRGGIERVSSWMHTRRLKVVASHCPQLVEQLRGYKWKDTTNKSTQEKGQEAVLKLDDDLCDALRYGVMTWPELPEAQAIVVGRDPKTVPEEALWAWERQQRINRLEANADGELDWNTDLTPLHDFYTDGLYDYDEAA